MIVIEKSPVERAAGEFAPMVPAELRDALRSVHWSAGQLYLEVMALPDGWQPSDADLKRRTGFSSSMLRKAKHGLAQVGLYVWDNVRQAGGEFVRICRYVTNLVTGASSQVRPSDPPPTVGQGPQIPPSTGSKREGKRPPLPHSRTTCVREAAGQPCRQCAALPAIEAEAETSSAAPHLAPAREVLAREGAARSHYRVPGGWRTLLGR